MRRVAGFVAVALLLGVAIHAVELGRAEGTLTIDKTTLNLAHAYAVNRQHNEVTNRRDDIKIVLTDKPLPPEVKLAEIDYNFPQGIYGVVVHLSNKDKVTHVVVQHPAGTYDGGFTDELPDFRFKSDPKVRGVVAGRVSSSTVKTNTMSFAVEAAFNAVQQ